MGPLHGIKVVEFAGLGPVPFTGMLLSDLGAEVVQINRQTSTSRPDQPPNQHHGFQPVRRQ